MNHERACLEERFTVKLHRLLEDAEWQGFKDVLRWNPDGRSFTIYQPKVFFNTIASAYFKQQTKYKSFQRQLNLYNFHRETQDGIRGVYSHPSFNRNDPSLCYEMKRKRSRSSSKKVPTNVCSAQSTSFDRVVIPGISVIVNSNTLTETKSQRLTFSNALVDSNVNVDLRALDTSTLKQNSADGANSIGTMEDCMWDQEEGVVISGINVVVNSNTPAKIKSKGMTFSNAPLDSNVSIDLRAFDTTSEQNSAESDTDSMGTIEGYFGPGGRRLEQYSMA